MPENIQIEKHETVKNTLKKLDKTAEKVLLVVDRRKKLLGTITDGDIRRFVLSGGNLDSKIDTIYNTSPICVRKKNFSLDNAKKLLISNKIELIPIVQENNMVVDFITWSQAFSKGRIFNLNNKINEQVVIMAGGRSTRLEPFTKILPKPLIPIGDKPIIEIIIDRFKEYGILDYYLILNYKADLIESYFNNIDKDYRITSIREDSFRGTAGGLSLLKNRVEDCFIVSNCDVIVNADFCDVLEFHKKNRAFLTILSSFQHYKIPYGVVKFTEGGRVVDIIEKPEHTCTVNTGVYIMNKECLDYIPEGAHFDITDLIKELINNKKEIFTYPVNENDYIDIGQWDEYKKAIEKMRF
ncbi:MAG: NTP transferase domain-containing protein [Candidatus Omnitrophica bacterium]|nr:NTP transferase domain-containing protein [Candidatus Omnitrophota bacterium]